MAILGLYKSKKSLLTPPPTNTTYTETAAKAQQNRNNTLVAKSLTQTAFSLPQTTGRYLAQLLVRARNRTL